MLGMRSSARRDGGGANASMAFVRLGKLSAMAGRGASAAMASMTPKASSPCHAGVRGAGGFVGVWSGKGQIILERFHGTMRTPPGRHKVKGVLRDQSAKMPGRNRCPRPPASPIEGLIS